MTSQQSGEGCGARASYKCKETYIITVFHECKMDIQEYMGNHVMIRLGYAHPLLFCNSRTVCWGIT